MSKTVTNKHIWVERQAEEMGLKNGFFSTVKGLYPLSLCSVRETSRSSCLADLRDQEGDCNCSREVGWGKSI